MKILRLLLLLSTFAAASRLHAQTSSRERTAEAAAEVWLAQSDAGKSEETWGSLAKPTRDAIPRWQWKIGFALARRQIGVLTNRKLRSATFTDKSPGGSAGEFVTLEFSAVSSNKGAVTEKVTTIHEADGEWRVSGYSVK